jgi:hypothetical protein
MRLSMFVAATVTVAALAGGPAPAASAAPYQPCAAGTPAGVDFNGDRTPDAAVGVPGYAIGGAESAGLVEIRDVSGRITAIKPSTPAAGGNFGRTLLPADSTATSAPT